MKEPHTGICLYARCDLTRANLVKKGNVLTKDSLEITFANSLSGHLGSVDPCTHVNVCADKHTHTWNWEDDPSLKMTSFERELRTDIRQVGRVSGSDMTETPSSIVDIGNRLWIIRVDVSDCVGEVDKVLGEIAEEKTHERLQKASVSRSIKLTLMGKILFRHTPVRHPQLPQRKEKGR